MSPPKRIRRSAEESKRAILDAAERLLIEGGPEAIRLQAVADEVGLTNPAILHHFGSREGLLAALMRHGARDLMAELEDLLEQTGSRSVDLRELIDRIHGVYAEKGYARLYDWLALRGARWGRGEGALLPLAKALHEQRGGRASGQSLEETQFYLLLINLVLAADAILGPSMRRAVGLPRDRATGRRFRHWLGELLAEPLEP